MTSTIEVRPLAWPSDLEQLERLDISFHTDVVFDVQVMPRGFALTERPIAPALWKQYHVAWERELRLERHVY